jgi:hypothetical protein
MTIGAKVTTQDLSDQARRLICRSFETHSRGFQLKYWEELEYASLNVKGRWGILKKPTTNIWISTINTKK